MSLDDTLQHLQDAAWDYSAALTDRAALTDAHLAGWVQVARSAGPLLQALDRSALTAAVRQSITDAPARPANRAAPDPTLESIAAALRDTHAQIADGQTSTLDPADVVTVVLQSTARTTAAAAHDSPNPQVRVLAATLETASTQLHGQITDESVRAVPASTAATPAPQERRTQTVTRDDSPRREPPAGPSRTM